MVEQLVTVEPHGAVAVIGMNRPEALNALSRDLVQQLTEVLTDAGSNEAVRAVVLAGGDSAFCAGADINLIEEMADDPPWAPTPFDPLFHTISTIDTPVVAAVGAVALGGGCELALACDTVVAGHSSRFGLPEVRLGVIPGAGGTQRLVHAVGPAKARLLLLTGMAVDAAWAESAGLVAEVVADEQVTVRAVEIATMIADNSPQAVALARDAVSQGQLPALDLGLATKGGTFARRCAVQMLGKAWRHSVVSGDPTSPGASSG